MGSESSAASSSRKSNYDSRARTALTHELLLQTDSALYATLCVLYTGHQTVHNNYRVTWHRICIRR